MHQTVNFPAFVDAFAKHDRKNQFTYEALRALFDYFTEYEESTGEKIELDVIAICCDWTEYESADEAAREYFEYEGMTYDAEDGHELETEAKAIAFLEDRTTVLKTPSSHIVIQNF